MEFRNLTPLDALCYKTLDTDDNEFHVIAMKIAYKLSEGVCIVDETDFPSLIPQDEFKGEMNQSSVRFESDLAPAKPKCDVIINASAYVPQIPPNLTEREWEKWDAANGIVRNEQGEITEFLTNVRMRDRDQQILLDKSLIVRGEKTFRFQSKSSLTNKVEFNLIESPVAPIVKRIPLDYEYAFGGENKLYANNPYSENLVEGVRLTQEQLAGHPEEDPPVAHTIYEENLLGKGFVESWYLAATQNSEPITAPQIYYPDTAFTIESIEQQLQDNRSTPEFKPAGFGAVSRTAPHRRKFAGTYDDEWLENRHPYIPSDFDFAYWNYAPLDQQIEFPENEMHIQLKNMTQEGDWQMSLPAHRAFVLMRMEEGMVVPVMLDIDTLIIEPENNQIFVTYRGLIPSELDIRVLEARFEVDPTKPLLTIQMENVQNG